MVENGFPRLLRSNPGFAVVTDGYQLALVWRGFYMGSLRGKSLSGLQHGYRFTFIAKL